MNQNQNDNSPMGVDLEEQYSLNISRRDLELLFKYLARADLKGGEVPELNRVISLFDPQKLKKI